jgi:hypothetical protein
MARMENNVPVLRPTSDISPMCIRGTACSPTNIPEEKLEMISAAIYQQPMWKDANP